MAKFKYQHGDQPLDGYTIEHGLGRGGFGEVYYALSDSGRQVALKAVQNYEDIELRGIAHCMNLKNPHLVTIFDVRRNEDGDPFVIMEYISGPSLRDLLDSSPEGLGPTKSAFFLRELAKGLVYLHDCGVVHRDLKPHNVFYEDGLVKIGDYSLSKVITTSHRSGHTVTVGTVHYMAPEISLGRYDHTVDIYALGVMLYEMLVGQPPFVGESMAEVLMRHLSGDVDVSRIDEPFATVVKRAMEKDPDERYQSAQEMAEALFGVAAIRDSVTALAPEGLSVVAKKLARPVPAGANANVQVAVASPAMVATAPLHGEGAPAWPVDETSDYDFGQQASEAARKFAASVGITIPEFWTADAEANDRLEHSNRVSLAIAAVCAISIATAFCSNNAMTIGKPIAMAFCVGTFVSCISLGLMMAARRFLPRIQNRAWWQQRICVSASGMVAMGVAALLCLAVVRVKRVEFGETFMGLIIALFLLDWRAAMATARPKRLALTPTLLAGTIGGVCTAFTDADPVVGAGILAGVALVLQVAAPWNAERGAATAASLDWWPSTRQALRLWLRGFRDRRAVPQMDMDVSQSTDKESAIASAAAAHADFLDSSVASPHSRLAALILSLIFPLSGLHRFYVGKWFTGLIWFLTGGIGMIGQVIDIVLIALGVFNDAEGRPLVAWSHAGWADSRGGQAIPVNEYSSIPARRRSPYWRPSGASRGLSVLGGLLVLLAVVSAGILPVLATAASANVFREFDLSASELESVLGTANWDETIKTMGLAAGALLGFSGIGCLILARHAAGGWHMLRVVVAGSLMASACPFFTLNLTQQRMWTTLAGLGSEEKIGPALNEFFRDGDFIVLTMLSMLLGLLAIFILAWPAKRADNPSADKREEEVNS